MVSNVLINFFCLQGTDSLQFPQVMAFYFKNECTKEETGVSATLLTRYRAYPMDRLHQELKLLRIWAPEKKFRSKCHIKVGIFILFFVNTRNLTKSEFQRRESYQYPGMRIKLPKRGKRGKVQVAPDSSTATFTAEDRGVASLPRSVVHEPAALAFGGSLLEKQDFSCHSIAVESESVLDQIFGLLLGCFFELCLQFSLVLCFSFS